MERSISPFPTRAAIVGSLFVLAWLAIVCWLKPNPIADEQYNFKAAQIIAAAGWPDREFLGMPPTYHVVAAQFLRWLGSQLWVMRGLNAALSIASIWIFAGIAARLAPAASAALTIAFATAPLIFSYSALAYTEPAALCATLSALWLLLRGKPVVSAAVLILACMLRQSSLAWIPMFALWWWIDDQIPRGAGVRRRLIGGFIVLAALPIAWFGLVAMGGPEFGGRGGNVAKFNLAQFFIFGLSLAIFWLPLWLARWRASWNTTLLPAALRPRLLATWLAAIGVLALHYKNLHAWNADPKYIRNLPLIAMDWHESARYLFAAIAVTIGLLLVLIIKNSPRRSLAILTTLFSLLFLAPHFLVDPRYYQFPMTLLFLTLNLTRAQAWALAIWSAFITLAFCPHIIRFGDPSGGIW